MPAFQDLTGQKYGKLTVLYRDKKVPGKKTRWICKCDCGNIKSVKAVSLKKGETKSCGCAVQDYHNRRNNAGCKNSKLYALFTGIKVRCYCETDMHYPAYGGRGIKMADEWKDDFWAFANYLESLPHYGEKGYSIDRIDVNGNYEPGNVRWATAKEQANNRRSGSLVTAFGKTQTISEWADEVGMNYYTLWSRIYGSGWDAEKALTTPIDKSKWSNAKKNNSVT